jgi:hypothetical protein
MGARPLAPAAIDQPPRRHADQPAAWVVRQSLHRPLPDGVHERLLHGIFGGAEVPVPADQRGERVGHAFARRAFERPRRLRH